MIIEYTCGCRWNVDLNVIREGMEFRQRLNYLLVNLCKPHGDAVTESAISRIEEEAEVKRKTIVSDSQKTREQLG